MIEGSWFLRNHWLELTRYHWAFFPEWKQKFYFRCMLRICLSYQMFHFFVFPKVCICFYARFFLWTPWRQGFVCNFLFTKGEWSLWSWNNRHSWLYPWNPSWHNHLSNFLWESPVKLRKVFLLHWKAVFLGCRIFCWSGCQIPLLLLTLTSFLWSDCSQGSWYC